MFSRYFVLPFSSLIDYDDFVVFGWRSTDSSLSLPSLSKNNGISITSVSPGLNSSNSSYLNPLEAVRRTAHRIFDMTSEEILRRREAMYKIRKHFVYHVDRVLPGDAIDALVAEFAWKWREDRERAQVFKERMLDTWGG